MKVLIFLLVFLLIQGCNAEESKMLPNGHVVKGALQELKLQKKFFGNSILFYPGAPDESTRLSAERIINTAIDKLIDSPANNLSEKEFWLTLEIAAKQLKLMDSEEMERGLTYMEDIMEIYEIESSDGRLNDWRYGFEPSSH